MSQQELDHALQLVECLLDEDHDDKTRHDLSELSQLLSSARNKADTSITFDSFAGAIEDEEQCSGYLQELEDCLNEVHAQISAELNKSETKEGESSTSPEASFLGSEYGGSKQSRLSDDEGIGLPDTSCTTVPDQDSSNLITTTSGTYTPTAEEETIIATTRNHYNLHIPDKDRTEQYITSLERELLVCKTHERGLVLDRADLVEKIRLIHGILEDKQRQLNTYVGECEDRVTASETRCETLLAERDAALAERELISAEHEALRVERDSMVVERDTMESDKWDIMKQLREMEDRCACLQQEIKFRDGAIKSLQDEHERISQECMCASMDSLQRTMSRSSSLRSKSSVGSKSSGFSRILTLRRHLMDSDTDSFGDEEAAVTNPGKKKSRPRIQFPLFSEDTEREKRKLLDSLSEVPMSRWKSEAVVAWLELAMKMPQYSKSCADNVKSGKVLLSLSDSDIQTGFGMSNPLHKRKLRLALDDIRAPDNITYPQLSKIDHLWVVEDWLPSIGLNQYKGTFRENLVDGRVLNSLTKKDMERHLGVIERSHQTSLMLGIELLAKFNYNLENLNKKRAAVQHIDTDIEIWTTARCAEWLISVDLKEYANKLSYSGIHGAVVLYDKEFSTDVLAGALGIPIQRKVLRRHMDQELSVLKSGGSRRHTGGGGGPVKAKSGRLKDQISRAFTKTEPEPNLKAFKPADPGTVCKGEKTDSIQITFDPEIFA